MKFVLAPLAGFTDAPFRLMCREGGADLTYTEMVSAAALAHGHSPTHQLLETMPGEGPVACQIFGATESDVAHAAREIEESVKAKGEEEVKVEGQGQQRKNYKSSCSTSNLQPPTFASLDLNAGCPMTKVTRCGAGAELVKDPAKIGRLLKAMAENTSLPVTLKTRLGPHPQSTTVFEILDAAQQAGAKGLTVHARYTSQMHGGEVHLDTLAEVVKRAKIPVTGNGSVTDAKTAAAMAATGVDAIMIGRAALARPDIFRQLKDKVEGGRLEVEQRNVQPSYVQPSTPRIAPPSELASLGGYFNLQPVLRHLSYVLAFREQLAAKFPNDHIPSADGFASVKMHTHLFRYFNGRPGAAVLRARLNSVRTLAEIREIISAFA